MPIQDLTPQLRTRLGRVEKAVGWFVLLAALLMIAGLSYYGYHTAQRKGWFLQKVEYFTCVNDASGIAVGDPVHLMGFSVGEITRIEANDPNAYYNVTVFFRVKSPYYGYLWSDSVVKLEASDFLGNRHLELVKGRAGIPTVREEDRVTKTMGTRTNKVITGLLDHELVKQLKKERKDPLVEFGKNQVMFYQPPGPKIACWIEPEEYPTLTAELAALVKDVKQSLPGVLTLTNKINAVLDNTTELTSSAREAVQDAQPVIANLNLISEMLTNGPGSLGEWLFPTNVNSGLQTALSNVTLTLTNANELMAATQARLDQLVTNVLPTLDNLANITSNLNAQVQRNSHMLSGISSAVIHADEMIQGLKRHWLLRSAFKTNRPPAVVPPRPTPSGSPRSRQP